MHSSYWLIYAQVLTVDEANGKEPCDREQLTQITKYSLGALFDHLKGRTLTGVVTNIRLLHHDVDSTGATQPMLMPDEYEGMAAALRDVLGSIASSEAGLIEFKIDTNFCHERGHLEDGYLFVHLRPGADPTRDARFSLVVHVKIPGMD